MRVNELKVNTPKEFEKMKNEFKKIYESLNLEKRESQNSKKLIDIFSDPHFLEGLDSCHNPYDLVDTFPLTGLNVKLNKSDTEKLSSW